MDMKFMDNECRERMTRDEHEPVLRRIYIQKEDLEMFGYTVRCLGYVSIFKGAVEQAHSEGYRKRPESELSSPLLSSSSPPPPPPPRPPPHLFLYALTPSVVPCALTP